MIEIIKIILTLMLYPLFLIIALFFSLFITHETLWENNKRKINTKGPDKV